MERRRGRRTVTSELSAVGSTATLAADSVPQHLQVVYRDRAPFVVSWLEGGKRQAIVRARSRQYLLTPGIGRLVICCRRGKL